VVSVKMTVLRWGMKQCVPKGPQQTLHQIQNQMYLRSDSVAWQLLCSNHLELKTQTKEINVCKQYSFKPIWNEVFTTQSTHLSRITIWLSKTVNEPPHGCNLKNYHHSVRLGREESVIATQATFFNWKCHQTSIQFDGGCVLGFGTM
jgi:hypothetical protein